MAQASIKDRIKEMRLRVLAEPFDGADEKMGENQSPDDDIKAREDNQKTDIIVREKTTKTKTKQISKSRKKKTSKQLKRQESAKTAEIAEKTLQKDFKAHTNIQVEKIPNERSLEQTDTEPEEEIGKDDTKHQTKTREPPGIMKSIANDKAKDEHKKSSTEIIELTDKWVELEVRSRLSGLEKQEKQTRAMLKEIVEILDRIETSEHSRQASPAVSSKKLAPASPISQTPENKKRLWEDVMKRIFVVMGTFVIFSGLIWAILSYLFFDI